MVVDAYYLELEKAENAGSEKDIQFITMKISEAQKKQKLIKQFFGSAKVPEISDKAHVRIEVQQKTSYELFAKIQFVDPRNPKHHRNIVLFLRKRL